ncbi:MAG: hypothetical protein HQL32_09415 [Planctomycetes bacterium]|nr:hypothetical protein [Planctomycetota bacterium]
MKSQDLLILLKIFLWKKGKWSLSSIGEEVGLSKSQVHYGLQRLIHVGLIGKATKEPKPKKIMELIEYGIQFMFPAEWQGEGIGMLTSYSMDPLNENIRSNDKIVWSSELGSEKGNLLQPIYSTVPFACECDRELYEYFALIDAYRSGRAREKNLALEELKERIQNRGVKFG